MIEKECCFRVREWNREELEKKHTKQLLDLRDGGFGSVYWSDGSGWCGECSDCGKECLDAVEYNRNLVLDILSHREHISNKIESKLLRKTRKKTGIKRDGRKTQRFNRRSNRQRH